MTQCLAFVDRSRIHFFIFLSSQERNVSPAFFSKGKGAFLSAARFSEPSTSRQGINDPDQIRITSRLVTTSVPISPLLISLLDKRAYTCFGTVPTSPSAGSPKPNAAHTAGFPATRSALDLPPGNDSQPAKQQPFPRHAERRPSRTRVRFHPLVGSCSAACEPCSGNTGGSQAGGRQTGNGKAGITGSGGNRRRSGKQGGHQ